TRARLNELWLQQLERAQILPRFVKAAAAKRCNKPAMLLDLTCADLPIAPAKNRIVEMKRIGVLILEHEGGLSLIPAVFHRKHTRAQHIEESMHLCVHLITKHPNRMMKTSRKLDRYAILCCRDQHL